MRKLFPIIIVAALSLLLSVFANISYAQSVSGTISQRGNPAPHVLVIFSHGNAEVARAITGNDGYYYIRNLPKGTYRVTIAYQGGTKIFNVTVGNRGGRFNFSI